jgi:CRISPR-associated protein Csb2
MLTFGIRYLTGSVVASDVADRSRVEWPPHPGRVFMALAAAHYQTGAAPAERAALLWLETQGAPAIWAGDCCQRSSVTMFVPVNDKAGPSNAPLQSLPALTRLRQPRTFAQAWLEDDTVWLQWSQANTAPHREALSDLAGKVTRIGHSSSLVQMWVSDSPPSDYATLVPTPSAELQLRIPGQGSLEDLDRRYNGDEVEAFADLEREIHDSPDKKALAAAKKQSKDRFNGSEPVRMRPELSLAMGYASPVTIEEPSAPGTVFDPRFIVLALERAESPYRQLGLHSTLAITDYLRRALLSLLPSDAPQVLTGHSADRQQRSESPHLALFPLPFVGRAYAHGGILGLALALPLGHEDEARQTLTAALRQLRKRPLCMGPLGTWNLVAPEEQTNLKPLLWTASNKGAMEWATVTPFVFDRHSKAKDKEGYETELKASIQLAWNRIAPDQPDNEPRVIITPVSAHLGAPAAHEFPRLQRKDGSQLRHCHAVLEFSRPVRGPLLLGAGRYRGYGLCRPM